MGAGGAEWCVGQTRAAAATGRVFFGVGCVNHIRGRVVRARPLARLFVSWRLGACYCVCWGGLFGR